MICLSEYTLAEYYKPAEVFEVDASWLADFAGIETRLNPQDGDPPAEFTPITDEDLPTWKVALISGGLFFAYVLLRNWKENRENRNYDSDVPGKEEAAWLQAQYDAGVGDIEEPYVPPVRSDSVSGRRHDPVRESLANDAANYPKQLGIASRLRRQAESSGRVDPQLSAQYNNAANTVERHTQANPGGILSNWKEKKD